MLISSQNLYEPINIFLNNALACFRGIISVNWIKPVNNDEDPFFIPNLCQTRSVFVVVLITELLVMIQALLEFGLLEFDWLRLGLKSLYTIWVVLSAMALLCISRRWLKKLPLVVALLSSYFLIQLVALTYGSIVFFWLLHQSFEQSLADLIRNQIVSLLLAGLALRYFYVQWQLNLAARSELKARLHALQSRIRPHFLFNSMNIIASLIDVDPEAAEQVVEDLSELFRASLNSGGDTVTWSEELSLCQRYLAIESLRLGDKLSLTWDIEGIADDVPIPLLTLQPILENAVYYGIAARRQGGNIHVYGKVEKGEFILEVSNPLPEKKVESNGGNGIALENIASRIKMVFGEQASLSTKINNDIFFARLNYPANRREWAAWQ